MRTVKCVQAMLFLICFLLVGSVWCCQAADYEKLIKYAPVYQFTGDECCYPVDVEFFIENAALYEYRDSGSVIQDNDVTVAVLGSVSATDQWYLDNKMGTLSDNGIISHYQNQESLRGYTVYGRCVTEGDVEVLQYWMFYVFNRGSLNVHEGDWEVVQVVFESGEPTKVMYSQHLGGQRASWEQVDRDGEHIVVYVAEGTHANYLRSFSGRFGVANDVVGDDGKRLSINEYNLVELKDQEWLNYSGHWGYFNGVEDELRGKAGPFGPVYRVSGEMWSAPLVWGADLGQADNNIFILEWVLSNFILIFILITVLILIVLALRIYHRHMNYGLGPRIMSLLYIDGLNKHSIGNVLCICAIIITAAALIGDWFVLSADIDAPGQVTGGFVDLISVNGLTGVEVNLLDPTMGVTPIAAFVIPLSLIIAFGLVILLLGTIGVAKSRKLGKKYLIKGVRLLIPVILILLGVMIAGSMVNVSELTSTEVPEIANVFSDMAGSPWGGQTSYSFLADGSSVSASVKWGISQGGWLLLFGAILMLIAGFMEMSARSTFFKERTIDDVLAPLEKKQNKKTDQSEGNESNEPPEE